MDDELAIKTEGLTKHYRASLWRLRPEAALADLNLVVPRGTVFGFLGPNGAGKTTTIRCLMDLIRPTRGRAWVLGKPCGDVAIRARIGYLPDTPAFGSHLTAWQFLSICSRLLKIPKADRQARMEEVLDIVKMAEHRHAVLHGYSRGMLQRIGIAQALLNRPDLLILDEPLTGLDPEGRRELLEIACSRRAAGVCVFFCSHILSDVEKLCDRVGILSRGKMRACGPLNRLLSVQGCLVRVPAGQDEVLKGLLTEADTSHRAADGSWVVEFTDRDKAASIKARAFPAGVVCEDRQEGLEEMFFRLTRGAAEAPPAPAVTAATPGSESPKQPQRP